MRTGLRTGLGPFPDEGYSIATATPADIAAIVGVAPDLMWRYDEAADATELVSGADNLTDQFSPTKQVVSAALGGILTTSTSENSSSERMDAASGSVAEAGAGTITIIHIYELHTAPGGNRQILGKRGTYGYEIFVNSSGHVRAVFDTTTSAPVPTVASDHGTGNAETVLIKRSETDNEAALFTRLGSSVLSAPGGDMTDAEEFSVGRDSRNAAGARHAMTMIWLGANGNGFGETERSAVATAFGLE